MSWVIRDRSFERLPFTEQLDIFEVWGGELAAEARAVYFLRLAGLRVVRHAHTWRARGLDPAYREWERGRTQRKKYVPNRPGMPLIPSSSMTRDPKVFERRVMAILSGGMLPGEGERP